MLIDDSELDEIEAAYNALRKGGRPPATGWVRRTDRLLEYNPYHDEDGRFTTASDNRAGGSSGGGRTAVSLARSAPSSGKGRMVVTDDVNLAAAALGRGERVRLRSVRQVSTLVDRLGQIAQEAMAAGKDAPNYDLCRVSVKGTNLFCAESKGIPRAEMPQFKGKPEAGSRADRLAKSPGGEVDGIADYRSHLERLGVGVVEDQEFAQYLKASQRELVGAKVGGMMRAALAGKYDPRKAPIFVSRDNYVVDGHHNWAAVVGLDARDGRLGDERMAVLRIDMDILDVLADANAWATRFGIRPKAAHVKEAVLRAAAAACGCSAPPLPQNAPDGLESVLQVIQRLREVWKEELHPRVPAGQDGGGQWTAGSGGGARTGHVKGEKHRAPSAAELAASSTLDPKVLVGQLGHVEGGKWVPATTKSGRPTSSAAKAMAEVGFEDGVQRMVALWDEAQAAAKNGTDGWSPALLAGRRDFYFKRNVEAHAWAREFGVKPEQVAGVMADLSNQNFWEDNVKAARAVFVAIEVDDPIVFDEGYRRAILRATSSPGSKPIDIKDLGLLGKTLRLSQMEARTAAMVHPDIPHGSYGYTHMERAIRIARGEVGPEAIGGPKLRSFYSNIIRPDLDTHATLDTHMIRILLDDPTIKTRDKMPKGDPRTGRLEAFGKGGRNDYMRQMMFEAARRRGVLPHQMQAVAWWRWRDKHGDAPDSNEVRRGTKSKVRPIIDSWSGMEIYRALRLRAPEHTIAEEDRDEWFNQEKYGYETGRTPRPIARRVREARAPGPVRRSTGEGEHARGLRRVAAGVLRALERHGGASGDRTDAAG